MAKKTIYIHPANNGVMSVTRVMRDWRSRSRKEIMWLLFSIDRPGAYWDDAWNVHVDGCDYRCANLHEAIARGIEVLDAPDPVTGERYTYEVRSCGTPYSSFEEDPSYYRLEKSMPMTINLTKAA